VRFSSIFVLLGIVPYNGTIFIRIVPYGIRCGTVQVV